MPHATFDLLFLLLKCNKQSARVVCGALMHKVISNVKPVCLERKIKEPSIHWRVYDLEVRIDVRS